MNWFALSLLGSTGAVVLTLCVIALFVRHRINRRHRVDPKIPTAAPLTWLADPRAAARLHRRLAKVGRTAGAVADDHRLPQKRLRKPVEQPRMVDLAEELRQQAVHLDRQVARTAQLPAAVRRLHLAQLSASVGEAELTCVRLVSVSASVHAPPTLTAATDHTTDITDVAGQVQRLAEAHRILQQIDERSGLAAPPTMAVDPTQVLPQVTSPR